MDAHIKTSLCQLPASVEANKPNPSNENVILLAWLHYVSISSSLKSSDRSVSGVSTSPQSEPDENHGEEAPESMLGDDMVVLIPVI